jgi:wobble nucleotide-excising tRNase
MGVYVHPVVLQVGYSSWIADEYPDAILHEAASRIYKILGEDSQANDQRQLAMEAYMRIDMSNITMIGS